MPEEIQPKVVPRFGGGINFAGHPAHLEDDEWTDSDGFLARLGYAETLPAFRTVMTPDQWVHDPTGTYTCMGIVQDPSHQAVLPGALVVFVENTTKGVTLQRPLSDTAGIAGQVTAITDTAGGTTPLSGNPNDVAQLAYLNSAYLLCCGRAEVLAPHSIARLDLFFNRYQTLAPADVDDYLAPAYLTQLGGHLVAGYLQLPAATTEQESRTLRVSDQGLETVWAPSTANSADLFQIDSAEGLTGVLPIGPDKIALFTRDAIYLLSPTGSFPPFVLTLVGSPGAWDDHRVIGEETAAQRGQFCGASPFGLIYRSRNNVLLLGRGPVGGKLGNLVLESERSNPSTQDAQPRPFPWDPIREVSWVGMPPRDGGSVGEVYGYSPERDTWSRWTLPTSGERLAIITGNHQDGILPDIVDTRLWVAAANGTLSTEVHGDQAASGHVGAYVDTKDFCFGAPPFRAEFVRIAIEWEALTNLDTVLTIAAAARDAPPAALGSRTTRTDPGAFTTLGTLAVGQVELPLRLFGKYTRFRFTAASDAGAERIRIRGFTLYWRRAGDRVPVV